MTTTTAPAALEKLGPELTGSPLAWVLGLLAFGAGAVGLLFASQATAGVAILAFAILLAIFARMAQARSQHAALLQRLGR